MIAKMEAKHQNLSETNAYLRNGLRQSMRGLKSSSKNLKTSSRKLAELDQYLRKIKNRYRNTSSQNARLERELESLRRKHAKISEHNRQIRDLSRARQAGNCELAKTRWHFEDKLRQFRKFKVELGRQIRSQYASANLGIVGSDAFGYSGTDFKLARNEVESLGKIFERRIEGRTSIKRYLALQQKRLAKCKSRAKRERYLKDNQMDCNKRILSAILKQKKRLVESDGTMNKTSLMRLDQCIRKYINSIK